MGRRGQARMQVTADRRYHPRLVRGLLDFKNKAIFCIDGMQNQGDTSAAMKINEDTLETLEEICGRFPCLDGSEVELEAEDLSRWPIKPWELDDTPEDEIGKRTVVIRLCLPDAKASRGAAIIAGIIDAAKKEAGIDLHVASEGRKWVPGGRGMQQINLSTEEQ